MVLTHNPRRLNNRAGHEKRQPSFIGDRRRQAQIDRQERRQRDGPRPHAQTVWCDCARESCGPKHQTQPRQPSGQPHGPNADHRVQIEDRHPSIQTGGHRVIERGVVGRPTIRRLWQLTRSDEFNDLNVTPGIKASDPGHLQGPDPQETPEQTHSGPNKTQAPTGALLGQPGTTESQPSPDDPGTHERPQVSRPPLRCRRKPVMRGMPPNILRGHRPLPWALSATDLETRCGRERAFLGHVQSRGEQGRPSAVSNLDEDFVRALL